MATCIRVARSRLDPPVDSWRGAGWSMLFQFGACLSFALLFRSMLLFNALPDRGKAQAALLSSGSRFAVRGDVRFDCSGPCRVCPALHSVCCSALLFWLSSAAACDQAFHSCQKMQSPTFYTAAILFFSSSRLPAFVYRIVIATAAKLSACY